MKTQVLAGFVALSIGLASVPTSRAGVSLAMGPAGAPLATLATLSFAVSGVSYTAAAFHLGFCDTCIDLALWSLGIGVILLDSSAGQEITLQIHPLTEKRAQEIGVSKEDCLVFNSDLDQVNAVLESVAYEAKLQAQSGDTLNSAELWRIWDRYSGELNPKAFMVLRKLSTALPWSLQF